MESVSLENTKFRDSVYEAGINDCIQLFVANNRQLVAGFGKA